jgi:hypothetical protein
MTHCEQNSDAAPHAETIISRHVRDLFRLLPRLSGFRVGLDLNVEDVFAGTPPHGTSTRALYPVVMQAIVELAECHPEAAQLMCGRTFARRLH